MATLASLEKQIEALTKKAEAIRKTEMSAAIKTVRDLISQFGLTAQDVGLGSARGRGKAKAVSAPKAAGIPKYRDPKTGKTWTGHGKPPGWIAGAADRTKFLIDGQAASTPAAVAPAPKAAKAAKAPRAAKATQAAAVKAAAPTKTASVKKATRAAKAATTLAAPAKKVGAGPKVPRSPKTAAKNAAPAKVSDKAADAAATAAAA